MNRVGLETGLGVSYENRDLDNRDFVWDYFDYVMVEFYEKSKYPLFGVLRS